MTKNIIIALLSLSLILMFVSRSCDSRPASEKGFAVDRGTSDDSGSGDPSDTLEFATRPYGVLLTKEERYRLIPIFKLNYNKRSKRYFTGSTKFYRSYGEGDSEEINNWNGNYMPGFEAAYGYNMVNLSQFDVEQKEDRSFFEEPVLINTVYFPALSRDTLNGEPVLRDYYMISVNDEDINADGFLNRKDLRRFYHFNRTTVEKTILIPENHSVLSSEYDYANDHMYVYSRVDENDNGQMEEGEPIELWWIDLAQPENRGRAYAD